MGSAAAIGVTKTGDASSSAAVVSASIAAFSAASTAAFTIAPIGALLLYSSAARDSGRSGIAG
jgi:hypothetical protein